MSQKQRFGADHAGHDVELEFDKSLIVINKAILRVDGDVVDTARIVYGDRDLRTTLEDGSEIAVAVHSGMLGEMTRAQLRQADGRWLDLAPR